MKKFSTASIAVLALFTAALVTTTSRAAAQQESVLYSFGNGEDGFRPTASLISDAAGNLYGTTTSGGAHQGGTIFELMPTESGGWTEKILFSFNGQSHTDPSAPGGSLVFDTNGNLYGTTDLGGAATGGTAFELEQRGSGNWTLKILCNLPVFSSPTGNLIFDASGNLYGTTLGGVNSQGGITPGVVFELTPTPEGTWRKQILHSFDGSPDGSSPGPSLVFDAAGNLYGATFAGGSENVGTVFELAQASDGTWSEKILRNAHYGDSGPIGSLIFDPSGNLYGTTLSGFFWGTVFELSSQPDGQWTESLLHLFSDRDNDGFEPQAGLVFDVLGNLYGTTYCGGSANGLNCASTGFGTVFEVSPAAGGGWSEKVLHSFQNNGVDGYEPWQDCSSTARGIFTVPPLVEEHMEGARFSRSCLRGACRL